MKNEDYNEILARIRHIKSLFAFGEGILPFLEELFLFIREVSPLLNDVSDSIMNTTGMMPEAATELADAVDQTSDATFTIMENVDQINLLLDELSQSDNLTDEQLKKLEVIRNSGHTIMTALQFHDIVSQKLIHVRTVLSAVQQKMLKLFTRVYELEIDTDVKVNILETFGVNVDEFERIMSVKIDVGTDLTGTEKKQAQPETKFDQDDIDSLFG